MQPSTVRPPFQPLSTTLSEAPDSALLEQLDLTLRRFDSLCVAPPVIQEERALWFHPNEFQSVNSVWESEGIDGVIAIWGAMRTFASGNPVSLAQKPSDVSPEAPEKAIVLLVCEYGPRQLPDPVQADYFRSAHFDLPDELRSEALRALTDAGLLPDIIPEIDTSTMDRLRGTPIQDLYCSCEWYGPHNIYGDGSNFKISLKLDLPGEESVLVHLRIERDGSIHRVVWRPSLAETGYEGHDGANFSLTAREIRSLLPMISRVAEIPPKKLSNERVGFWHGTLLTSISESVST